MNFTIYTGAHKGGFLHMQPFFLDLHKQVKLLLIIKYSRYLKEKYIKCSRKNLTSFMLHLRLS